jgi:hypothetical protein
LSISTALPTLLPAEEGKSKNSETKTLESKKKTPARGGKVLTPTHAAAAVVSIEHAKQEYFLGENVILQWRIRNVGDVPLKFSHGGDGRTPDANRALRFKVEVYDANGKLAVDPYPNPMNFGGMGGAPTLQPGEDYWDELQLMRYREITTPGTYTVKVYHDLGWEKNSHREYGEGFDRSTIPPAPRQAPIATTTIRFLKPDAKQARQVVDELLAMAPNSGRSDGERGQPYADFELVRYPVYLPLMKEMLENGDVRGLDAIGAMAFPEATAVLLDVKKHKNTEFVTKANRMMLIRTNLYYRGSASRASYLRERSWTDELKKVALASTWPMVAGNDREEIIQGARLIQTLGTKNDLPAVIKTLDRVLVLFKDNAIEQQSYPRPGNASEALANASLALLKLGATPPSTAATPGNAIVWLKALGSDKTFRPAGWSETARNLIKHEIPFIREVAIRNLPQSLDEPTAAAIAVALHDKFIPVQSAACELAWRAKLKVCAAPLIEVLKTTDNMWVMNSAIYAAVDCGVPNDQVLEICVSRLDPENVDWNHHLFLDFVRLAIKNHSGSSGSEDAWRGRTREIQAAWLEMIKAHRQELRDRKLFKPDDPALPKAMFPAGSLAN